VTLTTGHRVRSSAVNANGTWIRPTIIGTASLLLVALVACGAFAGPDLVVSELVVDPPTPLPGANVLLTAIVENRGDAGVSSRFFVRFDADGVSLGTAAIDGLGAGERAAVSTSWVAEPGHHTITAETDQPGNRIDENDESNNLSQVSVLVALGVAEPFAGVRVAIGPFEDRTASGFFNVGAGVADKIAARLGELGMRTVDRRELEETMQERGLNPYLVADAAAAAESVGAALLVTGSVTGIDVAQSSLILGAVNVTGGSAEVELAANVVDVTTVQSLFALSAAGSHEGTAKVKIDFGALLSLPDARDVCAGGLVADRDAYYRGEPIALGYRNQGPADWYGVEIYTSTGTLLRWLGWHYIATGACARWTWDQEDSFGESVDPSVFVAKLWDGASYATSTNVLIRPGAGRLAQVDEITVGTETFEESIVGGAVNRAVDRLVSDFVRSLESAPLPLARAAAFSESQDAPHSEDAIGQIAATLPDGRIVINVGLASGVSKGDFFRVVSQVDDAILGEVVVVEVRDYVSYAVKTSDFALQVGDAVRFPDP